MRNKDTKAATVRFREAINHIIAEGIRTKGKVQSVQDFAKSIGITPQNLSKYNSHNQSVTLTVLITSCKKFRINPAWVLLGEGEMFLPEGKGLKRAQIQKKLTEIQELLK